MMYIHASHRVTFVYKGLPLMSVGIFNVLQPPPSYFALSRFDPKLICSLHLIYNRKN